MSNEDVDGYSLPGDITVGGLFPLYLDIEYPEPTFRRKPEPLKCKTFHIRYYRFVLAMVYAVTQINNLTDLLPNITLGLNIYDSCYNELKSLIGTTWLLSGKREIVPNFNCYKQVMPASIIGDATSKASIPIARILGLYKYPQVSYGSTHPLLSDKIQFPSFLRTISSDIYEVFAISQLLKYFNWTWIGIIASDNDLGSIRSQMLTKEIELNGGCVEFTEILPTYSSMESILHILNVIKQSSSKVIVVYSTIENLIPLIETVSVHNVTDKVWISSSSWSVSSDFSKKESLTTLNGSLGVMPQSGNIPGLKEFLYSIHPTKFLDDIFIKTFWQEAFGCVWPKDGLYNNTTLKLYEEETIFCTGKESPDTMDPSVYDVYNFRYTYKTHIAVFAVAHALHQMHSCLPGHGPFKNGSCADIYNHQPWQLLHYLKKVKFNNTAGESIFFDENGDVPLYVDIMNWQLLPNGSSQYVLIGSYDARSPKGQQLQIDESKIFWNSGQNGVPQSVCSTPCPRNHRRAARQGEKICCFDCIPCSEGEILNPSANSECLKCPEDKWPDSKKENCAPKPIQFLSYEELLGFSLACIAVMLCLLTLSVLYLFIKKHKTPIVKANNRELSYLLLISLMFCFLCSLMFIGHPTLTSCMLRQVVFGVIFSICISSVLAKTITVIMIFNATNPDSKIKKLVGLRIPIYIVPSCTMVQIILCIIWLVKDSPFVELNMTGEIGIIVVECNEGSKVLFSCVLGYMGLLASISLLVAFLVRKLPDTFNEAKFITFSMLVFASVWVTFIPAYLSTTGKLMVAVEVFAILSSSTGLLACIFFPKCYIILLQPEMNSKHFIRSRNNNKKVQHLTHY
ncbi:extracellular calcium-sensing receptor-like [Discoglossus pictus]